MIHNESVAKNADGGRLVIVDRLSELDWLVEVINRAVKAEQNASKS